MAIASLCALAVLLAPVLQAAPAKPPAPAKLATAAASPTEPPADALPPAPPGMLPVPGGRTFVGTDRQYVEALGQRDPKRMRQVLAETPRHEVQVDGFYIDRTEVTQAQWHAYLRATARAPSSALARRWRDGAPPAGDEQRPITGITWKEIHDYLRWCGRRLPTEAEWTRAARDGDSRDWPWGSNWDNARCRSASSDERTAAPVGSYPDGASPCGALDMAGNVFEWVDTPFTAFEGFAPLNWGKGKAAVPLQPEFGGTLRILKGGGFSDIRQYTRIDARVGWATDGVDDAVGFRTARSGRDGVDSVRGALARLTPPGLNGPGQLDVADVFAREATTWDEERHVITGHRVLAFAHSGERAAPLTRVRREARDEPLPLGILVSTEPLVLDSMRVGGKPVTLPAGEYTLLFKAEGESKAHRDQRRAAEAARRDNRPAAVLDGSGGGRAPTTDPASPWPAGIAVADLWEDVEIDQDIDAILFQNTHRATVAYEKAVAPVDAELARVQAVSAEGGREWRLTFSVPTYASKRGLRFALTVRLGGEALP